MLRIKTEGDSMKKKIMHRGAFLAVTGAVGLLVTAFTVVGGPSLDAARHLNGHNQNNENKMDNTYTKEEAKNLKTVEASFDAWKNGTGSPYQMLDENVSWTIVGYAAASKEYTSRKAFIDEVITPFNQRMSEPLKPVIKNIYADGDTVIVYFDAAGKAADGKIYANTYAWFLKLKDDKIVRATAFFDSVHFNDLWTRVAPKK